MLALTVEEHACKTKRVGWDMVLEELDGMTMLVHGEEKSESFDKHVLFDWREERNGERKRGRERGRRRVVSGLKKDADKDDWWWQRSWWWLLLLLLFVVAVLSCSLQEPFARRRRRRKKKEARNLRVY